jgi:hypothetical protein
MSEEHRDGTVGEVIDQRVQVYGDPTETFARIAEVWSGILGVPVNATDVPLCLIGMKIVRTTQAPDYSDNTDDVEGYLDIFRQLVGEDMIHARSVTEYVELKKSRETMPIDYRPSRSLNERWAAGESPLAEVHARVSAEDFDLGSDWKAPKVRPDVHPSERTCTCPATWPRTWENGPHHTLC